MTNEEMKQKLIEAGVKNLKTFGYPDVNKENILTDTIYRLFFKSMLEDNIGKDGRQLDDCIIELFDSITALNNTDNGK